MGFQPIIWTLTICITTSLAAQYTPLTLVLKSSNLFSIDLYTQVADEKNNENLIISPLISQLGLSMTSYGARNETEKQLGKAIRLPIDRQKALKGYKALLTQFNNVNSIDLKVANKIFVANGSNLKTDYENLVKEYFLTEVSSLDSNPMKSVEEVNQWVSNKTNDNIKQLLNDGDIDDSTRLIILNAIYFKAKWAFKFDENDTVNKTFYFIDGMQKQVEMMYTKNTFVYGEILDLDAKYIELPYRDTGLKLVIVVPNKVTGLPDLEKRIRIFPFNKIKNYVYEIEAEVYLPKFKIESTIDLDVPLKNLGAVDMFGEKADFSGIADEPLYVSKVIQKAFISVNEEGSEASAAAGTIISNKAAFDPTPPLEVDRPFYFAIRSSSSVLFQGHVLNPKA